jgi:predicted 3-demethylubiquinone-9 3-methyltransferase (glyoxalase superfamily)
MQKITTMLGFDNCAEEAARFYVSVFPDSKILEISHYPEGAPMPAGSVMMVKFQLQGQTFLGLNGGPHGFTQSVSYVVNCESQEEVDRYWDKLCSGGGKEVACGWLTDKFGLSWQITPTILIDLVSGPDRAVAQRVMAAMMQMKKIDIAQLEKARDARD